MSQKYVLYKVTAFAALFAIANTLIPGALRAQTEKSVPPQASSGKLESPNSSQPTSKKKKTATASKSANVRSGEITALDTASETLTLKERTGRAETYVFSEKTHYRKLKKPADIKDFKIGDTAVLHFRRSRTDGAMMLTELDDRLSWDWLADLKKTTLAGTIKAIDEDSITVSLGKDNIEFDYALSEKTRWERDGKEVAASAFKPGDGVYIVPRALPSGNVMARAVANSSKGAEQEKERTAASVHGVILGLDPPNFKLTLKTLAGDTRNLALTDETEVKLNSKPILITDLKPGQHVSARLRHGDGGDEIAWRITVENGKKSSSKTRKTASIKRKPPVAIKDGALTTPKITSEAPIIVKKP